MGMCVYLNNGVGIIIPCAVFVVSAGTLRGPGIESTTPKASTVETKNAVRRTSEGGTNASKEVKKRSQMGRILNFNTKKGGYFKA